MWRNLESWEKVGGHKRCTISDQILMVLGSSLKHTIPIHWRQSCCWGDTLGSIKLVNSDTNNIVGLVVTITPHEVWWDVRLSPITMTWSIPCHDVSVMGNTILICAMLETEYFLYYAWDTIFSVLCWRMSRPEQCCPTKNTIILTRL